MMEVKVNVCVELSETTKQFITSLFAGKVAAAPATAEAKKPAAEPAQAQAPAPVPAEDKAPEETQKPTAEPAKPAPSTISINNVRAALKEKVNDHRDEIKAKLTELGAPSVTKLDASKYAEMYEFLNALD